MTHEKEENIMGWILIAIAILSIIAIINATPTPTTQDAPCNHSNSNQQN